jgi:hypothetical protein
VDDDDDDDGSEASQTPSHVRVHVQTMVCWLNGTAAVVKVTADTFVDAQCCRA